MKLKLTKPLTLRLPTFTSVSLALVGCGGTGSHIASGLAPIALALSESGKRFEAKFIDGDRVEMKNVGRQLFAPADIGRNKAQVLADRLNRSYGLTIEALPRMLQAADLFQRGTPNPPLSVVIGAVDNPAARQVIDNEVKRLKGQLWHLDCGNENHSGQVLLGNTHSKIKPSLGFVDCLPAPAVLYPDLIKLPKKEKRKRAPSCAELTAAGEQGLMVNRMAAAHALAILDAFLAGTLNYFGVAFDLSQGGVRVWSLDEETLRAG